MTSLILAGLAACSSEPPEVAVEALTFPVVRMFGHDQQGRLPCQADVMADRHQLARFRVGIYSELTDRTISAPPIVIDATGQVLRMEKIEGERGTVWMMVNPNGMMPVRFVLLRARPSGLAAAKALLAECRFLGSGHDHDVMARRRTEIRDAEGMAPILKTLVE
jgi:hypothetical protein